MSTKIERAPRLAVLIDADNASPRIVTGLFEEIASLGEASVRRIYGDFSGTRLKSWSEVLANYAIIPQQNFANTVGKNASDIALVIDAMDLLHTGRFEGFCLVSSDSDFTRLASRIREQGVDVFGFGEKKTPESFRQACKRFFYTENLILASANSDVAVTVEKSEPTNKSIVVAPSSTTLSIGSAVQLVRKAMQRLEDVAGWYPLSQVGSQLIALFPDFDPRSYGYPRLGQLVQQCEAFETRWDANLVYIRNKSKK